ncbi:MAG: hypothetical protein MJZ90_00495 [Bacteroidales bacterium]|nr:hypothetical protein [Bacteroidales bacterium]
MFGILHYVIIGVIIAVIVLIQFICYENTSKKIKKFSSIFPRAQKYALKKDNLIELIKKADEKELVKMLKSGGFDIEKYQDFPSYSSETGVKSFNRSRAVDDLVAGITKEVEGITTKHDNQTFISIVNSINEYLDCNKSVNDFHLMKDIVDRNCDSKEEEIGTQIPIPLYLGLVGTMSGILVGVAFLWFTGGLSDLLSTGGTGSGAEGIEALLGGVALAMFSSICGIVLTTIASNKFKRAKTNFEDNKNLFLSWIQAKLLPKLSDNIVGALREMTVNLSDFNEKFEVNIGGLDDALSKVNDSYKQQTELMNAVQKLADKDLSMKNLQLFTALTNSTKQIEILNEYLNRSNIYLENVKALNANLAEQEKRTQMMENIGEFIKTELEQIEARKGLISKSVGTVDDYLRQALDNLKESSQSQLEELKKEVGKQDDVLNKKSEEITKIVDELHQLTDVKQSISEFAKEMKTQNQKLDNLSNSIRALASAKESGNIVKEKEYVSKVKKEEDSGPLWLKILIPTSSIIGSVIVLSIIIANWDSILRFLQSVFKF